MNDRSELRQSLKIRRATLTQVNRTQASNAIVASALNHPRFLEADRIAAYLGHQHEFDPTPLLRIAVAQGKQCFVPILDPDNPGSLLFGEWLPEQKLRKNRFGIPEPEPSSTRKISARALDLVFVPLLGFDADCHRIGMGGGYYDRTFAFKNDSALQVPTLIGFGFEVQRVSELTVAAWDVPLDGVISEQHTYRSMMQRSTSSQR